MSARLIRGCLMRLSQALDMAVQLQLVSVNVSKAVKRPAVPRPMADNTWSAAEVRRFLDEARRDSLWPLWPLLALEGMRRGEALGLRWSDINWTRGTAHIVQTVKADKADKGRAIIEAGTKTKTSSRTVRLTRTTLDALRAHRAIQLTRRMAASDWVNHDLIVCTGRGTPVNPGNVIRSFDRIVASAGLRRIRVHDLRHTAATLLLLAGQPAKAVSERLGHKGIAITLDLYSHVLPDMQDRAAEAMDQLLHQAESNDGARERSLESLQPSHVGDA
jgi:integrase